MQMSPRPLWVPTPSHIHTTLHIQCRTITDLPLAFCPRLLQRHLISSSHNYQWRSQKFLIGEADFAIVLLHDCSIRVTALLGYLDLTGPVF